MDTAIVLYHFWVSRIDVRGIGIGIRVHEEFLFMVRALHTRKAPHHSKFDKYLTSFRKS